jgi:uncharacterized protein YndB with AHSA1/START domain
MPDRSSLAPAAGQAAAPGPTLPDHVFTVEIAAPIERVWDEITRVGTIQRFMHNTVLESTLAPGARLRYYSPNHKRVFVVGEIVEVTPPRRFTHTFLFTMRAEAPSLVTWELEPTPGGCRVTLVHGGWTDQLRTHRGVIAGWREILDLLKGEVETGEIPLRKKALYRVLDLLMFLLPASTRVEAVSRRGGSHSEEDRSMRRSVARWCHGALLMVVAGAACRRAAAQADEPLAALRPLIGGTWVATDTAPERKGQQIEITYSWGTHARSVHYRIVRRLGTREWPTLEGMALWHPVRRAIVATEIDEQGNVTEGTFTSGPNRLDFDEVFMLADGQTFPVRGELRWTGPDTFAFRAFTRGGDDWRLAFALDYRRLPSR